MNQPSPIGAQDSLPAPARPEVRAAIAQAAQATGVDFAYLLGQARLESSLDPGARAVTSSATGLYQFTSSTWLATMRRHGAEHGYGWAENASRDEVLALRYDPRAAALMAAELAGDNSAELSATLGREPDAAELYMAHFLGSKGASRFLTALAADPSQSAAALFPAAAAANRGIFYERSGTARSLGGVIELMRGKMTRAMGGESFAPPLQTDWAAVPLAQPLSPAATPDKRPSMAETLAATFGTSPATMPDNVRGAYDKLRAFGL